MGRGNTIFLFCVGLFVVLVTVYFVGSVCYYEGYNRGQDECLEVLERINKSFKR